MEHRVRKDDEPRPVNHSGFVIFGFLFMWVVGLYPLMSSAIAEVSPTAALVFLVALPLVLTAVLMPLYKRHEAGLSS